MENSAIVRRTDQAFRPPARCRRSQTQSDKKRPYRNNGDGFLAHSFLPFWGFSGNQEEVAREYFSSLANLCTYYKLPKPETDLPFPENIYQTWQEVEKQIRGIDSNQHCMIIAEKGKKAVLTVVKTYNLTHCLFYIPVRPYWRLTKSTFHLPIAELATAIFAYLHQIIGIPFYMGGSFMDYQYDTLEQWVSDAKCDSPEENWQLQEDTIYELRQAGGHVMRKIEDPEILKQMYKVVMKFKHQNSHELEWGLLAIDFLQLYRQYPKRSLSDCVHEDLIYPDEDERITVDQYTSFYWSDNDCFQNELLDMINCSFQELPVMDEPTALYFFDEIPAEQRVDFEFENRLFGLIERLRDLLNICDDEEYYRTV